VLLVVLTVVAAGIGAWAVLHGRPHGEHRLTDPHPAGTGAASGTRPPVAPSTTSTTLSTAPLRGLAVSTTQTTFTDPSRQLESNGVVLAPARSLPTYIWAPSSGGPFPLVVFVHGYDIGPLDYQRFCSTLASSGYVVAAPSFPLEDPSRGFGLNRGDIPNEATDVSFVISSLLGAAAARMINPGQIAVIGHSDGADVALLVGYGPGHVDARVRAVVSDAPDPMTGGVQASNVPLLLIQGTADSVVPYSSSGVVFDQIQSPVDYVSLLGADHLPPIAGGTPWTPVLDNAVADFLDAIVADRGAGPAALSTELAASPLVRLESKG
jgi:dienelactone hydrolase